MKYEEIEQMSAGIQIDALIAEKVMQLPTEHLPVCYEESFTDDGLDGWSGFVCPRCHRSEGMLDEPCAKRYSLDIAAAWEVVESWQYNWTMGRDVGQCGAEFETEGNKLYRVVYTAPGMPMAGVTADTAPLAICRAALLAVLDAGRKQAENP